MPCSICGRGEALEVLGQPRAADNAFALALGKLPTLPPGKQETLWLRYGFATYRRLPDKAARAFGEVLQKQPHHPEALYGKAMLLVEQKKEAEAITCYDEALAWHPFFVAARRSRAILLARQGKFTRAREEADRCLLQEPSSGRTRYVVACVLALWAASTPNPGARRELEDQALEFLTTASQRGHSLAGAAADPDLAALRHRLR